LYLAIAWRFLYLALAVGLFIFSFYAGTAIQLTKEQAENIKRELGERNQNLDGFGIFANNVIPALEMFIPAAGVGIGTYAAFSTGQALNAFAMDNPALKNVFPLSLLLSPFALLEIFAYALGMSRSAILVYFLITKRKTLRQPNNIRHYIIPTIIEIGIVIVILFIGSVIEWQILSQRTTAVT
jgi:hypothetical protein